MREDHVRGVEITQPLVDVARPPPAASDQTIQLDERQRDRLHNHLYRLVCSHPWETFLYSQIEHQRLPYKGQCQKQHQALYRAGAYPPGGPRTRMLRCWCCRRWFPPQAIYRPLMCGKCFSEWLDDSPSSQRLLSKLRRSSSPTGRGQGEGAEGRCRCCRKRGPVAAARICEYCDADRMSPLRMALLPSANRASWIVKQREAAALLRDGTLTRKRSSRAQFKAIDGRIDGGFIDEDGILHEPWGAAVDWTGRGRIEVKDEA